MNLLQHILIWAIRAYRLVISPAQFFIFGANGGCRFTPSCSQYAMDAIARRGAVAGSWLAAKRICRCHPFNAGGHDPAPEAKNAGAPCATKFC
jgi:putative membrane protein insertion efficiency factor